MELFTLGIDLGKTTFHVVGMNQRGEVVLRKRFSRVQLLHFTANLKVELIGMEACGGSHFLGRALREQGHEVRLIPAQYVKPYVKTNKSDYIDAEAIAGVSVTDGSATLPCRIVASRIDPTQQPRSCRRIWADHRAVMKRKAI
jgi:transposase